MGYELFKNTGLNDFQSKILYNLIKLKEAKASELSKITDISRVRVYDILNELYALGLIKKIESRPTKFIAFSPKETIKRLKDWKERIYEREKEELNKKEKEIENELNEIYKERDKEKPENILELISLGEVSESETKELIQEAGKEVKILSESLEYIDSIYPYLKGKNVKAILKSNPKSKETQNYALKKLKELNAEVKFFDKIPMRGTIIDNKKAIINIRDEKSSNLLRDCIYTTHKSFLEALNIYFKNIWEKT